MSNGSDRPTLDAIRKVDSEASAGIYVCLIIIAGIVIVGGAPALAILMSIIMNPCIGIPLAVLLVLLAVLSWLNKIVAR